MRRAIGGCQKPEPFTDKLLGNGKERGFGFEASLIIIRLEQANVT